MSKWIELFLNASKLLELMIYQIFSIKSFYENNKRIKRKHSHTAVFINIQGYNRMSASFNSLIAFALIAWNKSYSDILYSVIDIKH